MFEFSHVGWVRRSRNPTRSRQLPPLLGFDAARLTQPTQLFCFAVVGKATGSQLSHTQLKGGK